jgi:hypothetical protein
VAPVVDEERWRTGHVAQVGRVDVRGDLVGTAPFGEVLLEAFDLEAQFARVPGQVVRSQGALMGQMTNAGRSTGYLPATFLGPRPAHRRRMHWCQGRGVRRVQNHVGLVAHIRQPTVDLGDLGRLLLEPSTAAPADQLQADAVTSDQASSSPDAVGQVERILDHERNPSGMPRGGQCRRSVGCVLVSEVDTRSYVRRLSPPPARRASFLPVPLELSNVMPPRWAGPGMALAAISPPPVHGRHAIATP